MKIDCHIHTHLSSDSFQTLEEIFSNASKRGLDGVLIVDHNIASWGDLIQESYRDFAAAHPEARKLRVFRGGEYSTPQGHIIVTGLERSLEKILVKQKGGFLTEELIREARLQGAAILLAHPYRLARYEPEPWLMQSIDAVEVFNGRSCFLKGRYDANLRAMLIAKQYDLPITVGTNAHSPGEIGRSYVEFDVAPDEFDFRRLREYRSRAHCRFGPPLDEWKSKWRYYLSEQKYSRLWPATEKCIAASFRKLFAPFTPNRYIQGDFPGFDPTKTQ